MRLGQIYRQCIYGFEVKVGLHQGSALSHCFFAMVMDRITDDIREDAPWTMMFADDIVFFVESSIVTVR